MASILAEIDGCADDVDLWRTIVKNNKRGLIQEFGKAWVCFFIVTNETWLPSILSQTGFFESNNQVKKNQPQLWRDAVHQELISLSWAKIRIFQVDFDPNPLDNPSNV